MSNYPLRANKYSWRSFTPETNHYYTDEYTASMYDMYLTDEYIRDRHNNTRRYYRFHAKQPHSIEMALAYDIKCPRCKGNDLKQVGRCKDFIRWVCTNVRCATEIREGHGNDHIQ